MNIQSITIVDSEGKIFSASGEAFKEITVPEVLPEPKPVETVQDAQVVEPQETVVIPEENAQ